MVIKQTIPVAESKSGSFIVMKDIPALTKFLQMSATAGKILNFLNFEGSLVKNRNVPEQTADLILCPSNIEFVVVATYEARREGGRTDIDVSDSAGKQVSCSVSERKTNVQNYGWNKTNLLNIYIRVNVDSVLLNKSV